MQEGTSFGQSLSIQWRVIRALLMREMITRFGRHNIGFLWLFAEPAMFCAGVLVIRTSMHENTKGLPVVAFVLTGYSSVLLWRNCGNRCSCAVTPNLSLLYHHNVRVLDVVFARIILELGGCALAFLVLLTTVIVTGLCQPPDDWAMLMWGYLMLSWYAAALGIWVCACTELSEVFERIWHPLTYFMLPICGLGFMVNWLPLKYQKLAVLVPMVNGCEMLRCGYFGKSVPCHFSVLYLSCWCFALMLVGMTLLKIYARKAEPQ